MSCQFSQIRKAPSRAIDPESRLADPVRPQGGVRFRPQKTGSPPPTSATVRPKVSRRRVLRPEEAATYQPNAASRRGADSPADPE